MPGRVVSESEGMPGAAILLETHTHKNRECAFFVGVACCSWEGAEGRERISVCMDWVNTKNDSPLKMRVERSRHKGSAWWVLWCLLGISNPQESVRNPVSEYRGWYKHTKQT